MTGLFTHRGHNQGRSFRAPAISYAETLKMHAVYTAGANMKRVGRQFGRCSSAVSKAFARWNLPVRPSGTPKREVIELAPVQRLPAWQPSQVWCEQCDRRVAAKATEACQSQFCPFVAIHRVRVLADNAEAGA